MNFYEEFVLPLELSFIAVVTIILIITADLTATLLVAICILMTDLFLVGLVFYWGLSFNCIVVLQIILGIGTSVDYSAHIAYAYLIQGAPEAK